MVMISFQDLALKFMVPLMHILDILSGAILEFPIELQYLSISNIFACFDTHYICQS